MDARARYIADLNGTEYTEDDGTIIKDGQVIKVTMAMMDAAQQATAARAQALADHQAWVAAGRPKL